MKAPKGDYKYAITLLADNKAMEKYKTSYEDLSSDLQMQIHEEACQEYWSDKVCFAEHRMEALHER
jgi:hypothetical protein